MKQLSPFVFAALLLFSQASCTEFKSCTFSGIESAKIVNMSSNNVEIELHVKIKNPNDLGFDIYPSDFDVSLGKVNVGKASIKNKVHIKANSEVSYPFVVKTDMSKIMAGGMASVFTFFQKQNADVVVKGDLKAGKLFYRKTFPVDLKEKISLN